MCVTVGMMEMEGMGKIWVFQAVFAKPWDETFWPYWGLGVVRGRGDSKCGMPAWGGGGSMGTAGKRMKQ